MAPKSSYKISYNVDETFSDLEETHNLPTPPKSENVAPTTKKRAAAASKASTASKVTKPRTTRASGGTFRSEQNDASTGANAKRKPLDEIPNTRTTHENTEDIDEFDQLPDTANSNMPSISTTERDTSVANNAKAKAKTAKGRAKQKKAPQEDTEPQQLEATAPKNDTSTAAAKKKGRGRAAKTEKLPEVQPEAMEVDDSTGLESNNHDAVAQSGPSSKGDPAATKNTTTRMQNTAVPRKRAGSASDSERAGNDPALRRKLGDMTKKFESMELKYSGLRAVAESEAASNFDKLKQRSDEKTKAADELIVSLRSELAAQKAKADEAAELRAQLEELRAQNESLAAEKKTLAASLTEAQSEAKGLQSKLATARSISNSAQGSDAQQHKNGGPKNALAPSGDVAKDAQKRMLKEDLYSDLTGLILLDVKQREEEGDNLYDCIQTGRNGTLHFHLSVANSPNKAISYENVEFQYTPLLDENRDKDLIDILPDYLTEEICFPRSNAGKFYSRVVDCLTKKIELVD